MPEEKELTDVKDESSEDKPTSGKSPVILLAVIMLVQLAAAWGVAQFVILPRMAPASPVEETADEAPTRGNIFLVEGLVVTLMEDGRTHFLKVTPGLECENSAVEEELESRMPEIRDLLINRISTLSVAEVVAREGRDYLKEQILEDLNGTLREGKLLKVYFSEFVVQ